MMSPHDYANKEAHCKNDPIAAFYYVVETLRGFSFNRRRLFLECMASLIVPCGTYPGSPPIHMFASVFQKGRVGV